MSEYVLYLSVLLMQTVLLAQATDAVGGHVGKVGVSSVFFAAIGGYVYAVATVKFGMSPWIAILIVVGGVPVVAMAVTQLFLGLNRNNYLLATVAAQLGFLEVANNTDFLGGPYGIAQVPAPEIGIGSGGDPIIAAFILLICCTVAASFALTKMVGASSRIGRMLHWIRDDMLTAQAWGLPIYKLQGRIFLLHAIISGITGAGMVISQSYVSPDSFGLNLSLAVLTVVFLSGTGGSPLAMYLGTAIVLFITELLRSLSPYPELVGPVQHIILNIALIVLLLLYRRGIAGPILEHDPSSTRLL